jgi:flagellar export protein FliJ
MKKFVFSLQKVLSYKEQILNVKKNELAILQMQLMNLNKEINELNNKFTYCNKKMIGELENGLNASDIIMYKTYFNTLNQQIRKLTDDRIKLQNILEQKKHKVIEINSEISGLEKLRDKQLEEYNKTVQKINEKAMDEYVGKMHSTAI